MKSAADNDLPLISVIVPVRNEEKFIARTLQYILKQDYPDDKLEVIVVDGVSDDKTAAIVEEIAAGDPRVKLLSNPKRLSSAARNIGAKAARGDIITYIDGHVYIDNGRLLKDVAGIMGDRKVSVLSRPQFLDTPGNSFFQQAVAAARKSIFGHGLDSTIYTREDKFVDPDSSGAAYRREVFEKVGYFDEDFDAAEDWEFNYRVGRAGFKSFTSFRLAVYYYPRKNLVGLFRQMKRYGIGRFRFLIKHRRGLSSGTLFPVLFVMGLIILPLLSLISGLGTVLLGIFLGSYLAIDLFFSIIASIKNNFRFLIVLPPIYFIIHAGTGWGFISEALRRLTGKS
jgi:succinoglycan biosynthesis protein ExoA